MAWALMRVPIEDADGEYVEAEVARSELTSSIRMIDGVGPDLAKAQFSLASSFDRIMPALSGILMRLRNTTHAPDEIDMSLGLKIGGETGLIFARGTSEATFTVNLRWRKLEDRDNAEAPAVS